MIHFVEIIVFGSLILLSFILISNPLKLNVKANIWLGVFMLLWATYWIEEITLMATGLTIEKSELIVIPFIQFLTPITFYLCIKFYINPNYKFTKNNLLFLLAPFVYITLLIYQENTPFNVKPILLGLTYLNAFYFIFASYATIFIHKKGIKRFASNIIGIDLYWLEQIIKILIILMLIFFIFNILFYSAPLNIIMNLITLFAIYYIAFNALSQKEIYPVDPKERMEAINASQDDEDEMPRRKLVSDERLVELKYKLNELMQNEEPYLDTELNLINLSKQLQVSSNHLSYIINNGFNENFYGYINKFRIKKAKKLLIDKNANHLSIIGIAYESGFSSKTSFNTIFKKVTGLTPSEFKKRSSHM